MTFHVYDSCFQGSVAGLSCLLSLVEVDDHYIARKRKIANSNALRDPMNIYSRGDTVTSFTRHLRYVDS